MSNLVKHAEKEMRLAGLYDKDAEYGGMIPKAVMALIEAHSKQGHSGMSHSIVMQIFNRVANFKNLTPLTDDPAEWMEVDRGKIEVGEWQNMRNSECFSKDGGKTYTSLADNNKKIYTSKKVRGGGGK